MAGLGWLLGAFSAVLVTVVGATWHLRSYIDSRIAQVDARIAEHTADDRTAFTALHRDLGEHGHGQAKIDQWMTDLAGRLDRFEARLDALAIRPASRDT